MMKNIFLIGCMLLAFASCSKEGVEMYDANTRYLYIQQTNDDGDYVNSKYVTFQHHPGANTIDVYFDVHLVGLAPTEDMKFKVSTVTPEAKEGDETVVASADEYQLDAEQVFHKGKLVDQVKVTLKKSARMDNQTLKLILRIEANENFGQATYLDDRLVESLNATITFDNKIAQPTWWNEDIVTNYLGEWTPAKYRWFIQSCNGEVLDLSDYTGTQKMELAIRFKEAIEANNWTEDDGSPIELPIY